MKLSDLLHSNITNPPTLKSQRVTKSLNQIFTVSHDSSPLEKELLESFAYARVLRSPLHLALRKYQLSKSSDLSNNETRENLIENSQNEEVKSCL